jgi:hypothetical protein
MTIVHDFAFAFGGAERVTANFASAFPRARVVALGGTAEVFERMKIIGRVETLLPMNFAPERYRAMTPLTMHARGDVTSLIATHRSASFGFLNKPTPRHRPASFALVCGCLAPVFADAIEPRRRASMCWWLVARMCEPECASSMAATRASCTRQLRMSSCRAPPLDKQI